VSRGGADVVVRLNRPMRMTCANLEAVIGPRVQRSRCEAESADHVRLVGEIIDELEAERGIAIGTTKMLAMVETADAFFRIHEIAKASPRLVALNLGAEDFALSPACCPRPTGSLCRSRSASSRRAPRHHAARFCRHGRRISRPRRLSPDSAPLAPHRLLGASVIHPTQVAILNEEFRPAPPRSTMQAVSSLPTTRRSPKASALSRSTAR